MEYENQILEMAFEEKERDITETQQIMLKDELLELRLKIK